MAQPPPEELPESIVIRGFAGLKNTLAPERLGAEDLERALNIDLDDTGQPRRRRGYTLKDAASYHSIREIGGKVYGVRAGVLGIIRANYSFTALQTVGDLPVCYAEVNGDVYFSSAGGSGMIAQDETVSAWGSSNGQNQWLSPVIVPTNTLGAISGKLLGSPPVASSIEAYKGRIYLANEKVLWATELYLYHYVDKTKNYMSFEHDITLLMAVDDGIYVGTTGGLYFIKGTLGAFAVSQVSSGAVLPGSGVWVSADFVHPNARQAPMPTGQAAVMLTAEGVLVGFDGGTCYNLTHDRVVLPDGVSAAALYRQDQGVNTYVAAVDSAGGPSANTRIGDYVDAEIIRASQGG
jgi:hypothetical protein